jgi:MoxR-like ATPase
MLTETEKTAAAAATRLANDLNRAFAERRGEIRGMLVALVAREHVLLLGPPGTAKSALTGAVAGALSGSFFQVLMTRFTVPEEVFGPISLKGLENDEYRRVTAGYLPSAEVGFVDEIFKANSSILNAMLTILNERQFDDGGHRLPVPLEVVVGASNELPKDDALEALFDRFMLRFWTDYVKNRDTLRSLLADSAAPKATEKLSRADLEALRGLADRVDVSGVVDLVLDVKDELARKHGITCSDRRWRKAMALVRASAALAGREVAQPVDLTILADSLWRKPEERPAISAAISALVAPTLAEALRLLDAALDLTTKAGDFERLEPAKIVALNRDLNRIKTEISRLPDDMPEIADAKAKVVAEHARVARVAAKALGL